MPAIQNGVVSLITKYNKSGSFTSLNHNHNIMFWSFMAQCSLLSAMVIFFFLIQHLISKLSQDQDQAKVWASLETVGLPSHGLFSWTCAIIGSISSLQKNAQVGYEKICKAKDRPFALPSAWSGGAVVVLPPSMLSLLDRPRSELGTFRGLLDTIELPYMFSDSDVYENTLHFDVIRKKLTNKDIVRSLAATTAEEFGIAFREYWGDSKEWKTVNGWDACEYAIMKPAMRILLGLPLCRDERLLKECSAYVNSLFMVTGALNCLPPSFRRLVGPILAIRVKYLQGRCERLLVPFVEEQMHQWKENSHGKEEDNLPDNFLHWMLPVCSKAGPEQFNAKKITLKLLALNTMFVFALAYMFGNSVLDLYASPNKNEFLPVLEEECRRVSKEHAGLATKEAIDSLYRVDSAMRESMRISDAWVTAFPIDIVSEKVDIGHGIKVPPGIRMAFPTQAIHLDPDNFEDPQRYDALRFSRKWEHVQQSERHSSDRELVTTMTKSFLAFGYGRHGCPGRWWSAQTIKQGLASIVLNYDVEVIGGPSKRKALLTMMLPPNNTQIRIKRKL